MNITAVQVENSTALWDRRSEYDAKLEPLQEPASPIAYKLVPSDSTEYLGRMDHHAVRAYFLKAIIGFSDALDSRLIDTATEFASIKKSVFDVGRPSEVMMKQLDQLIAAAHDENFEVGIESRFSRGLQRLCRFDSPVVLGYLRTKLIDNNTSSEVLAEILRWASHQDESTIRAFVVDLLSTGLHHASSLVRDAAALSLAHLDESTALARLRPALEIETVPELREDLEELIRSLENRHL